MLPRLRPRLTIGFLPLLILGVVACGTVRTAVCDLSEYAIELQGHLQTLATLDPALVVEPNSPENAAALAAIDELEATSAAAQEALDATSEDEVGTVIRSAFQLALDATEAAATNLRAAVESGDVAAVTEALGQVQTATEAIDAFLEVADENVDCPTSPSASGASTPSEAASATVEPTRRPRPSSSEEPEPTESPEPTETP